MRVLQLVGLLIITTLTAGTMAASGSDPKFDGLPDDGILLNPLKASVEIYDPDNATVTWLLDGAEIGTGQEIQWYVYPGTHNLTVNILYTNGTLISRSFELDPVPPPGWDDEPDNTNNRVIFWFIFGSGGAIFALFVGWLWLRKDDKGTKEIEPERVKIQ